MYYHLTSYFESIILCFEMNGKTIQFGFSKIPRYTYAVVQISNNSAFLRLFTPLKSIPVLLVFYLFLSFFFVLLVITSIRSQTNKSQIHRYDTLRYQYTRHWSLTRTSMAVRFFFALTLSYSFTGYNIDMNVIMESSDKLINIYAVIESPIA